MKSWILCRLPLGTRLPAFNGINPGQLVHVIGWTHPGSVDVRRVIGLERAQCQGGVMLHLDEPLRNQPRGQAWVSVSWTREGGKT